MKHFQVPGSISGSILLINNHIMIGIKRLAIWWHCTMIVQYIVLTNQIALQEVAKSPDIILIVLNRNGQMWAL